MTKASNQRRKSRLQRRADREESQRRNALIEQIPMGFGAEISERVIDAVRTAPQKLRETREDRYMFAAGIVVAECLRFNVAEMNTDAFFEINRDPQGDNAPIYSIRVTVIIPFLSDPFFRLHAASLSFMAG